MADSSQKGGANPGSDTKPTARKLTIRLDTSTPSIHLDPLITKLALDGIKKLEIVGDPKGIEWAIILLGDSPFQGDQGIIASGKSKTKVEVEAKDVTGPSGVPYAVVVRYQGKVYFTGLDDAHPADDDRPTRTTYSLLLQPKIVVRQSDR